MTPIRLAVIGGGKVSERFHLPVAKASDRFDLRVLVDRDLPRAQGLAKQHGVPVVTDRLDALEGAVDAAIVATPHHLHAPMTLDLLARGIHVLVEKPMALDVADCDAMIAAAAAAHKVLAVGLLRRFYPASRFIKEALDDGVIGSVTGFDAREGAVFNWQVASDATFRRDMGGGVLSDIGTHVLDLLVWWLGDPLEVAYADDAMGGVEADAEATLTLAGGVTGSVELSRTRVLRNTIVVRGHEGSLELGPAFDPDVRFTLTGRMSLTGRVDGHGERRPARLEDVFALQLADFGRAIDEGNAPFVSGAEGRRSIALLEACRRTRRPLELPWSVPAGSSPPVGSRP
jgi:predicted dehydrogenase